MAANEQKRILVVDDDSNMLHSLTFILEASDFAVSTAGDGESALAMILAALENGRPFDALVTDLQMPNMNGLELLQAVNDRNIRLPQIALSAAGENGVHKHLQNQDFIAYLAKPFKANELVEKIRTMININCETTQLKEI